MLVHVRKQQGAHGCALTKTKDAVKGAVFLKRFNQ